MVQGFSLPNLYDVASQNLSFLLPMSTPKRKAAAKLATPVVKPDARRATKNTIDESRTTVAGTDALQSSQADPIEISDDADSDEDLSDMEDANDEADAGKGAESQSLANGPQNPKTDDADDGESDAEGTSPSFGELLRGNEIIDVNALLQQSAADSIAAVESSRSAIAPPTHQSLTTVLTQALKSDDTDLLESCLHTTDIPTIQNTIERIDSSLAGVLLNKLAARLHRRPGRAGTLMTWVQWTLVAHGGALAAQPKLLHDLNSLQKVLAERAKGLNSLLALKGKLDILEGQMELRRKMQRSAGLLQDGEDDADEEDVIYVEGEENDVEKDAAANGARSRRRGGASKAARDDEEEDDDDRVLNGFIGDSEDEEEGSEQGEDESDAGEEPLDEDEVDFDDVDESMGEDDESDVEVAPPTKMQKVTRTFGKKK
ncbi:U3 small nucleolar RNA-associated protein 5 [Trichoderma asperellum]|uniref:U3 small nucleolar RNA-associated protein 5 n=1 Tax=Trichoderma asperellum TaxID=101201 RepID=A0A6V8R813_TRIAP|nr:U3 small nucleolar RNA-associated protein 5 [Trichoderma asperellum]